MTELNSRGDLADRLTEAGVVFAGATLLLAAIAAVVALVAYAVSSGAPDIQFKMHFPFSEPNNPIFTAEWDQERAKAKNFKQLHPDVFLRNISSYSARNPAVIVRLGGMFFRREAAESGEIGIPGEWVVTGFSNTNGITEVQWDGGPEYSIHGKSTRKLPDLRLDNLSFDWALGIPEFTVEILAEGYRKVVVVPAVFQDDVPRWEPDHNPEWL